MLICCTNDKVVCTWIQGRQLICVPILSKLINHAIASIMKLIVIVINDVQFIEYSPMLTRSPTKAPLPLAQGKNIPNVNMPKIGPPQIPKKDIAACQI